MSVDPKNLYEDTSRYHYLLDNLEIDQKNGKMIPGMLKDIEFPESNQDEYYITNHTDLLNLENLSYRFYGEAKLWWVIGIANNIIDPFEIEDTNLTLRIPSYSTVRKILDNLLEET